MSHLIVVPKHVDIRPSEDVQLTETYESGKYMQLNHTGQC
jgi:hypothetical protein